MNPRVTVFFAIVVFPELASEGFSKKPDKRGQTIMFDICAFRDATAQAMSRVVVFFT